MDWIERYLQAVKFALPKSKQEDIVRELRDSILSQVEERESALGRALTEDEQLDILRKMGSPTELASRYGKKQALIGAGLLPIYWKVLQISLLVALVAVAGSTLALAAAGRPINESLQAFFRYPNVALSVFAWVTLVFALCEYFGAGFRVKGGWNPRKLPPLTKQRPTRTRTELIAQFLVQTIFATWWLTGLHYQYLIFGPGIAYLHFGPIWLTLWPLFLLTAIVDISFTLAMFVRPDWTKARRIGGLAMSTLGLVVVLILLESSDLFVPTHAGAQGSVHAVNKAFHIALVAALIVNIVNIAVGVGKLIGSKLGDTQSAILGS